MGEMDYLQAHGPHRVASYSLLQVRLNTMLHQFPRWGLTCHLQQYAAGIRLSISPCSSGSSNLENLFPFRSPSISLNVYHPRLKALLGYMQMRNFSPGCTAAAFRWCECRNNLSREMSCLIAKAPCPIRGIVSKRIQGCSRRLGLASGLEP